MLPKKREIMQIGWLIFGVCALNAVVQASDQRIANCDCVPVSWFSDRVECFVYCDNITITENSPYRDNYLDWVNGFLLSNNTTSTTDKVKPWTDHKYFNKTANECGVNGEKIHNHNIKLLHFRHCAVPEILMQIFETGKQQSLNMSNQHLDHIRSDAFDNARNLQTLIAAHNQIAAIPPYLFVGATNLEYVDFSYNEIQNITAESMANSQSVIELNLAMNRIDQLQPELFEAMSNLKKFNVSGNQIREISAETFAGAQQLTTLDLSYNDIEKLSSYAFDKLSALETLSLRSNRLHTLPLDVFVNLGALKYLDLAFTHLTDIKLGTFSFNRNLQSLDLTYNWMERFDFGLFMPEQSALTYLSLDSNQITELRGFSRNVLPNLETFLITNNAFDCSYLEYFFETMYWTGLKLRRNMSSINTSGTNINGVACFADERSSYGPSPGNSPASSPGISPEPVVIVPPRTTKPVSVVRPIPAPAYETLPVPADESSYASNDQHADQTHGDTMYYRNAAGEVLIFKSSYGNEKSWPRIAGDMLTSSRAFVNFMNNMERLRRSSFYSFILLVILITSIAFFVFRYVRNRVSIEFIKRNGDSEMKPTLVEEEPYKPYTIPINHVEVNGCANEDAK